jgi:hypothetical protein
MHDLSFVKLDEVFSEEQIQKMVTLLQEPDAVVRIHNEVILPHMSEINRITRQENDPMYWAYVSIFALDTVFNPDAQTLGNQTN